MPEQELHYPQSGCTGRAEGLARKARARGKARRQSLERSNCYLPAATPAEAEAEEADGDEGEAGSESESEGGGEGEGVDWRGVPLGVPLGQHARQPMAG